MALSRAEKVALARGLTGGMLAAGYKVFAWPMEWSNLRYENGILREQNLRLSLELMKLREARLENRRLRGLLDFKIGQEGTNTYVTGRVIARDPDRTVNTILIDVGSTSGVQERMPVVTAEGLVGRVLESHPRTSVVQILLDPNCRVSAIVQREARTQGIVMVENGVFYLKHVPARSDVEVGDLVVSSGLGGVFPKGLLVGEVADLGQDEQGLFQEVILSPSVNFENLEEVFVLEEDPQTVRSKQ
jgi:rod shape-determining protein MreC